MDSCFCKQDSRELSPPPSSCHMRMQGEVSSLQPGRDPSPESDHVGTLILDFQPPKLGGRLSKILLYKSRHPRYFAVVT